MEFAILAEYGHSHVKVSYGIMAGTLNIAHNGNKVAVKLHFFAVKLPSGIPVKAAYRRKANGKQKEWEKRYNAKRKAQVEAAKATIRAEDMEKGIFTTVSQLPRQEPRKATVSASATV